MSQLARFEKRIYESIPLSHGLGMKLEAYDGHQLLVSAPLAPNHNHQNTAFGGSLYAVAVTASWGLVELVLQDAGLIGKVVVQSGEMTYLEPVDGDFFALCALPDDTFLERFHKTLARHGKGRMELTARVYQGVPTLMPPGDPKARFQGRFVVQEAHTTPVLMI